MKKVVAGLLKDLRETIDVYWNVGPEVGQFLNLLTKEFGCKTVLEIGTSNGYSGIWIAEALAKNKGRLFTIESNKKKRFGLATENFDKAKLQKNITQILGHAPEAIPKTPKFFDLILLDATKYEHIDYLKAVIPRTKKGSIIIADNIVSHRQELQDFLTKALSLKNFKCFEYNIGKGLLLMIRINNS
jgi:predicted O-methyltransferase YrrM